MTIAIVGAGLAGLTCATALAAAGRDVTLFDKGRAAGGRMATRRIETSGGTATFDHGAQYFTARDPAFRAVVDQWHADGLAAPWPAAGPDAWVGTPAMTSPVRALAEPLTVHCPIQIDAVGRTDDGWTIGGLSFDTLAVAFPAEQAGPLLRPIHADFADRADATPAAPCWTVMVAFPDPLALPDTLRQDGEHDPIGWAARNNAKPGRTGPESWVIQAGPDWSRNNLERTPDEIVPLLLAALAARCDTPPPEPLAASAHRWRYARSGSEGSGALWDPTLRLGVCGDWLIAPRIEAAWLSGTKLAAAILA